MFSNIILIILSICVIYLLLNQKNGIENLNNTDLSLIKQEINRQYNMDIEAIRNLGAISKSLLTGKNYHTTNPASPGTLTIPGNVNIEGNMTMKGWANAVPIGTIIMWGKKNTKPQPEDCWRLCDGTNGTPDLTNRVPRGTTRIELIGDKAGKDKIVLTEDQLPRHNHVTNIGRHHRSFQGAAPHNNDYTHETNGDYQSSYTSTATGNSAAVDIKPQYTLVVFYMRVK